MTAEFNITIPGAEIIKRLVDLETQNADLISRVGYLEEQFVRLAPAQYVDNQLEVLSKHLYHTLREEVDVLKDRLESTKKEVTAFTGAVNVLITTTERLHDRVEQLEDAVGWSDGDNMANAYAPTGKKKADPVPTMVMPLDELHRLNARNTTPNHPANDPKPPVDTSWHPYDAADPRDIHPADETRVMVMQRTATAISGPFPASSIYWGEQGEFTIVAWRYAKEGE